MTPAGGQAVADDVADGDADAVAADQVDDVVPVAADVQGADGRPVADGDLVAGALAAGGEHRVLEGEGDLAFAGVGVAQPVVELLEFAGAGVQLGLQDAGATAAGVNAGPDQFGDLLDPVDEEDDLAIRAEHGRVDRAPVALLPLSGRAVDSTS